MDEVRRGLVLIPVNAGSAGASYNSICHCRTTSAGSYDVDMSPGLDCPGLVYVVAPS